MVFIGNTENASILGGRKALTLDQNRTSHTMPLYLSSNERTVQPGWRLLELQNELVEAQEARRKAQGHVFEAHFGVQECRNNLWEG